MVFALPMVVCASLRSTSEVLFSRRFYASGLQAAQRGGRILSSRLLGGKMLSMVGQLCRRAGVIYSEKSCLAELQACAPLLLRSSSFSKLRGWDQHSAGVWRS
ncbi:hypothetical protein BDW71DRAFT_172066 [Aspergillus fruticulosus]